MTTLKAMVQVIKAPWIEVNLQSGEMIDINQYQRIIVTTSDAVRYPVRVEVNRQIVWEYLSGGPGPDFTTWVGYVEGFAGAFVIKVFTAPRKEVKIFEKYVDRASVAIDYGPTDSLLEGDSYTITCTSIDPEKTNVVLMVNGVRYTPPVTLYATRKSGWDLEPTEGPQDYVRGQSIVAFAYKDAQELWDELAASPLYEVVMRHQILGGAGGAGALSSLIFPSGSWATSLVGFIDSCRFTFNELLSDRGKTTWAIDPFYRQLLFRNHFAIYGVIDTGLPQYVTETRDYGGGQVAEWKRFTGFKYPSREPNVKSEHRMGWEYAGDAGVYQGGVKILEMLNYGIMSTSEMAPLQAWLWKTPSKNYVPEDVQVGSAKNNNQILYGRHIAEHLVWTNIPTFSEGYVRVETPLGVKRLLHVWHTEKVNTTLYPADGTEFFEGQNVEVSTEADDSYTLDKFLVDGVSRLTENPYVVVNATEDIYIGSRAIIRSPSCTDGTPYSFQPTCPTCGTNTWSAAGLPSGLTIDSATGLISGTVPYETASQDYYVTVTVDNDGREVSKTFILPVVYAEEPIPGTIWTPITKLDSEITAMVQLANADVLIGTDAKKIYSTSDFVTFTPVFTSAATIAKIVQLASGRVIALGSGAAPDCAAYSDDNGANWTKVATGGGEDYRDGVELSATLFIGAGGSGGAAYSMSSTDSGATYAGWWSYYNVGLLNGFSKVIKFDATSMLALRDRGAFSIIKCAGGGVAGTLKYTIAGSDGTMPSCNFVTRSDGKFLFGAYNELHIGTADGETWALHKTLPDWGGIATPGMAYSMASEPAKQAVWVAIVGGLGITHVLRSVDDGENFVASVTDIDGAEAPVMIQLANRDLILGTNGATTNLWKSEA